MRPPRGTPVPGNRWDLLPGADSAAGGGPRAGTDRLPEVSVVIPYYRDQAGLDLLLAGLARQDLPPSRLQVVIADDGSPRPPELPSRYPFDLQVVRQPDAGFRASAARALGASVAEGEVLAFLDGDMIPDRDYLRRALDMPARSPEAVVVGRRRHLNPALLGTGWAPGDPVPQDHVLEDPEWLERAYATSRNLLDADSTAYRFIISAVLTLSREVHDEAGGFDPGFVGYGGEDWELAHRLWRAGALLAHEPAAVAWHAGPDFAGREDPESARRVKNREALVLARRISAPTARGYTLGGRTRPRVAVHLMASGWEDVAGPAAGDRDAAATVLCADALLQAFPAAALTVVGDLPEEAQVITEDPRVTVSTGVPEASAGGPDGPDWTVTVHRPLRPVRGAGRPDPAAANEWLLATERSGRDRIEVTGPGGLAATLVSVRARARRRRWGALDPTETTVLDLEHLGWTEAGRAPDLEAWWGGWG